jgi:hypothetical protein
VTRRFACLERASRPTWSRSPRALRAPFRSRSRSSSTSCPTSAARATSQARSSSPAHHHPPHRRQSQEGRRRDQRDRRQPPSSQAPRARRQWRRLPFRATLERPSFVRRAAYEQHPFLPAVQGRDAHTQHISIRTRSRSRVDVVRATQPTGFRTPPWPGVNWRRFPMRLIPRSAAAKPRRVCPLPLRNRCQTAGRASGQRCKATI